jgi:RNA polymerase sigma factor (sigma-70 family)
MSSHLVFNGCDDAVKARLETYWAKKVPRLQHLLVHYRPDLQEMRLTVYCHTQNPQRSWYEIRGVIHLPTGTLATEANEKDPQAALDRIADALVTEIKRHKERVRKDYLFKRKSRQRADVSAAGPLLYRDRENGRRQDFFRLLRPLSGFLREHARRELRILELEGTLHRGEVTLDDLMDDVLIRAWHRFGDRPQKLPLESWLTQLLHETLEEWIKQEPWTHASLEEKAEETLPSEGPQADEQEWWQPLLGYEKSLTLEDLIPDWEGTQTWDQIEAEEQRDQLLSLMSEFPAEQRQAFFLYALEDYDPAEIAMLQDRPESQVKADIDVMRQKLKERVRAGGNGREAVPTASASSENDRRPVQEPADSRSGKSEDIRSTETRHPQKAPLEPALSAGASG